MKKSLNRVSALSIIIVFIFSGCSVKPRYESALKLIPTPIQGKATIVGMVISEKGVSLSGVPVKLAKIFGENKNGIFVLDNAFSPSGITNQNGEFLIENFDLGAYVLVIGNPEGKYEIIDDGWGNPKIWSFDENNVVNIGAIKVKNFT